MTKRVVDLGREKPLLDIASYGRVGSAPITRAELELIDRTVRRSPEVLVKVSGGARTLAGVEGHLRYIGRAGRLALESDSGERAGGKGIESVLIEDWNLDLEARARRTQRSIRAARKPPKLVHNLIFSMPAGTPPKLVLRAVRKLARDQFGSDHRYALVLHTDEPHPHVHLVVKAVGEQGERLNIRKATLREWRRDFAANLRELGVAANATERAVRGNPLAASRDGIYRAKQRGDILPMRGNADSLGYSDIAEVSAAKKLLRTRVEVVSGWRTMSRRLEEVGYRSLAARIDRFVGEMAPVRTGAVPREEQSRLARSPPALHPFERTR
jgi:Relaxase/Mobilisation nuclease domain